MLKYLFNKVPGPQDYSFIKRRLQHRCFLVKFAKLRSSHSEMFLVKDVLKICSKFTGKHPCQNVISIKLLCNFIEITLPHGCSPVNLLHIYSYSEHLWLKTPLDSYFWKILKTFSAASVIFSLEHPPFMWQENSDLIIFIFSVPFCEFDSMLHSNFEKNNLLHFDGIDLSHRK